MILLTRPYKDSAELADILGTENCLIEPMMEIQQLEIDLQDYIKDNIQAVVVTSKNTKYYSDVKIPEHGKNAYEVLNYCLNNLSPEGGKILYLSGDTITLDIAEELRMKNYDASRVITYKQILIESFSNEFLQKINDIKIATFFSNQTITNFIQLAEKNKINTENITCICIANQVAEKAKQLNWKTIKTAKQPNAEAMLDLIKTIEY